MADEIAPGTACNRSHLRQTGRTSSPGRSTCSASPTMSSRLCSSKKKPRGNLAGQVYPGMAFSGRGSTDRHGVSSGGPRLAGDLLLAMVSPPLPSHRQALNINFRVDRVLRATQPQSDDAGRDISPHHLLEQLQVFRCPSLVMISGVLDHRYGRWLFAILASMASLTREKAGALGFLILIQSLLGPPR